MIKVKKNNILKCTDSLQKRGGGQAAPPGARAKAGRLPGQEISAPVSGRLLLRFSHGRKAGTAGAAGASGEVLRKVALKSRPCGTGAARPADSLPWESFSPLGRHGVARLADGPVSSFVRVRRGGTRETPSERPSSASARRGVGRVTTVSFPASFFSPRSYGAAGAGNPARRPQGRADGAPDGHHPVKAAPGADVPYPQRNGAEGLTTRSLMIKNFIFKLKHVINNETTQQTTIHKGVPEDHDQ